MADIRPFHGVRYNPARVGDLAAVVAAPYDIITREAQEAYHARSDYNVVRLELGTERADDTPTANRYTRASTTYRAWLNQNVLQADTDPSFYLYEEAFDDRGQRRVRRSIYALIRLTDWNEGVVLPHEFTMAGPKVDRLNLLATARAQFSPLLAMFDDPGPIGDVVQRVATTPPDVAFTLRGGAIAAAASDHRLWRVSDPDVTRQLVDVFGPLQIYIADGHHRYETALVYRDQMRARGAGPDAPSEFVLMTLVDMADPGMLILPTHRLVRGLGEIDRAKTIRMLSESFVVERRPVETDAIHALHDVAEPLRGQSSADDSRRPSFTVLGIEPGWRHVLTVRPDLSLDRAMPGVPAVLRVLDTTILQRLILEPVFGISEREIELGTRVQFTRDPSEAVRAFASGDAQLAFFLNSTPMDQLRAVARAGERMPQKTTYFYPKPVTGVVFFDHELAFSR